MATTRDIRRLAFQALFQLDARGESDLDAVRASVMGDPAVDLTEEEREQAYQLAIGAYADRRAADDAIRELAPTWPAHRQPAVDRVILRLAHFEMTRDGASPKIAVNEAIELAKQFSTERSPAFINGVLDKVLKRVLARQGEDGGSASGKSEAEDETPGDGPALVIHPADAAAHDARAN